MLTDPATSPNREDERLRFGAVIAYLTIHTLSFLPAGLIGTRSGAGQRPIFSSRARVQDREAAVDCAGLPLVAARLAEDRETTLLGESVHCVLDRGFHFVVDRVDVGVIAGAFWVLVDLNRVEQLGPDLRR